MHQAVVAVDEEGAEAAAATGFAVAGSAGPPLSLIVDHPCLFLISDEVTGSVLFLRRLSDPTR